MRAVTSGCALLGVLVAAGLGTLQAADPAPVTIAVLRGDGVLIPIATRAGTKWEHTWPVPAKASEVPLDLDAVPKRWWGKGGPAKTWHAWQIDGTRSEITVERPIWYLAHCQQGVGLKTGLTSRPPIAPPKVQPYPKLGLASSARVTFKPLEAIDQASPLWTPMVAVVTKAVNAAEDATTRVTLDNVYQPHPIDKAERARTPVKIESLYRMPLREGRFLYYVEASKRYGMPRLDAARRSPAATPRKDGCSLMSFANGWFVAGSGREVPELEAFLRLTSCEYDDVSLMLPLGYLDDGEEPVWIAQFTGWTAERYSLLRWNAARRTAASILDTHGGWCADGPAW